MAKSLKEYLGLPTLSFRNVKPHEYAHCIIDVQREFCDPKFSSRRGNKETNRVSGHIASVAPLFRAAHVTTYVIYFARGKNPCVSQAGGGLYKLRMSKDYIAVAKNRDSAFEGSDIGRILKRAGHRHLLVSGFNTNACVKSTVLDALCEGLRVDVMEDCVGNDNHNIASQTPQYIERMRANGAYCRSSYRFNHGHCRDGGKHSSRAALRNFYDCNAIRSRAWPKYIQAD